MQKYSLNKMAQEKEPDVEASDDSARCQFGFTVKGQGLVLSRVICKEEVL